MTVATRAAERRSGHRRGPSARPPAATDVAASHSDAQRHRLPTSRTRPSSSGPRPQNSAADSDARGPINGDANRRRGGTNVTASRQARPTLPRRRGVDPSQDRLRRGHDVEPSPRRCGSGDHRRGDAAEHRRFRPTATTIARQARRPWRRRRRRSRWKLDAGAVHRRTSRRTSRRRRMATSACSLAVAHADRRRRSAYPPEARPPVDPARGPRRRPPRVTLRLSNRRPVFTTASACGFSGRAHRP